MGRSGCVGVWTVAHTLLCTMEGGEQKPQHHIPDTEARLQRQLSTHAHMRQILITHAHRCVSVRGEQSEIGTSTQTHTRTYSHSHRNQLRLRTSQSILGSRTGRKSVCHWAYCACVSVARFSQVLNLYFSLPPVREMR